MTPNAIEILIHCHVSPIPHPRRDSRAVAEELESLEMNGLIKLIDNARNVYTTTDRGAAHVSQLCKTPWPVQKWVDAHGKIIGE